MEWKAKSDRAVVTNIPRQYWHSVEYARINLVKCIRMEQTHHRTELQIESGASSSFPWTSRMLFEVTPLHGCP